MEFDAPGTADFFEIKKYIGSLAIIAVNEYLPAFATTMGVSKAVRAEVVIIDGPGAGDRYDDAMFFGKKIVPQMQSKIGTVMLGRITQGQARPGQSAPYELAKFTPDDLAKANAWVTTNGPVEAKPVDSHSAGSGLPYAPDSGPSEWRANGGQPPSGGGYPTPPARPQTYVTANAGANPGADDEPPF